MTTPNWKQLAAIPESVLKTQIPKACGIESPIQGVSTVWQDASIRVEFLETGTGGGPDCWSVYDAAIPVKRSGLSGDGSFTLRATGTVAGTPTGDALRTFSWHG